MGKTRLQIGRIWKRYKCSVVVITIFLTIGIAAITYDWIIPPNPNHALYNEMPELEESENGYLRLYRSGVSNVTSTQEVTIDVWFNNTFYLPSTDLSILYYNGTNAPHYNASESHKIEDNFWNYMRWWTDYDVFYSSDIASNDSSDTSNFVIPTQKAGSEIIVQICIRQWNVSSQSYLYNRLNSTYTVLYSTSEVSYQDKVQTTTAAYILGICVILSMIVVVWRPRQIIDPSTQKPVVVVAKKKKRVLFTPGYDLLVDRCNHLDMMRIGLRTGSSLLMAIGLGLFVWLISYLLTTVSQLVFAEFLVLGSAMLILGSFVAIILSFSSLVVSIGERSIGTGLVPVNCTKGEYNELLKEAVRIRESMLEKMTFSIGMCVIMASVCLLLVLLVSMLPDPIYLLDDLVHQLLYFSTFIVIAIFTVMSAFEFFEWIGIISFTEKEES